MTNQPESNRRDFLKGRTALDALRGKVAESVEGNEAESGRHPSQIDRQLGYLEQYSKNAMACEFELMFNLHQYPQSGAGAMEAFQLIDLLEDQMTVYRDHSEISQLNRNGFDSPIRLEERLFDLLLLAKEIHQLTNGAFDVTSAQLTRVWGFDKRNGNLPAQTSIDESLERVGTSHLGFDLESQTIKILKQGVAIDLGGIGKGHALDRVADLLESFGILDFVIHGGQSSVLARGSSLGVRQSPISQDSDTPESAPHESELDSQRAIESQSSGESESSDSKQAGWFVGVSHPTVPGVRLCEIELRGQALGTSGTGRQGFFHRGKRYGHIIDPRTGWPASHFLSTTVVSPSAAISDALATAFFVMTQDEVEAYCRTHPAVSALLMVPDGKQKGQVRLELLNFDHTNIRMLD
ncbi:MAG: thiamine biosynthesis lipoprotein [Mariniblastus sp.]|jgi:thiamine biosynthesis lipoprotein